MAIPLLNISNYIWDSELEQPNDTSVPAILYWLQNAGLGQLNNFISTDYIVNGNDSSPQLTIDEASILTMLYLSRYYGRKVQSHLGANAYTADFSELSEGDSRVRKVSRNQIAQTYIQMKKDVDTRLDKMVALYKANQCIPGGLSIPCFAGLTKTLQ